MTNNNQHNEDIIDDDLHEEFDDEELLVLVEQARQDAVKKAQDRKSGKTKRPFPKWSFWLIAIMLMFNVAALLPQTLSIPAIDFLLTSAKLSTNKQISDYKDSVVVVETDDSRGTGFSITDDGKIITNNHVVEDQDRVVISFKEEGLFNADVIEKYPEIDLAVLQTDTNEDLPHLNLAEKMSFTADEPIYFIGNPLKFTRIANEGTILDSIQLSDWDQEVMMIKAPVYRGNSGSPVINMNGEVIGIVFATLDDEDFGRVGLFIPIDYYYNATN